MTKLAYITSLILLSQFAIASLHDDTCRYGSEAVSMLEKCRSYDSCLMACHDIQSKSFSLKSVIIYFSSSVCEEYHPSINPDLLGCYFDDPYISDKARDKIMVTYKDTATAIQDYQSNHC